MAFYKHFQKCQGCLICTGPECAIEKNINPVGDYQICDSCFKRLHEKGFLDLDDASHGATITRLYPDGSIKLMKQKTKQRGRIVSHTRVVNP